MATSESRFRFAAPIIALLGVGAVVGLTAQQAAPPAAPPSQGAPTPAPAPPAQGPLPRPETAAMTAAMALKDPAAKIAAIEKVRTDFPQSTLLASIDTTLLGQLVSNFPEKLDDITVVFDRMIGRISPTASPDTRLNQTLGPVNVVVGKKILLDKSEKLMADAIAALSLDAYATVRRDAAKRTNQPEPAQATIETAFHNLHSSAMAQMGRIYLAKGEDTKAEAAFKEGLTGVAGYGASATALVDYYNSKNDFANAEAVLKDAVKTSATPVAASRPAMALVDLYTKKGDTASAEALLKETLKDNPTLPTALVALAKIEDARGDSAAAVDHYMTAAVAGSMKAADDTAMRTAYKKVHGSETGLEDALDKAYNEKFPNPVKTEAYKPTAARSNRVVLLEMFTGSGCPPCVAADLAMDAAMQRYPADSIVALAYHQNIPQPDPMVAANNNDRRLFYSVTGVPTFEVDGVMIAGAAGTNRGGGGRTQAPELFDAYKDKIEKALETPATAGLTVKASGSGDIINVTANVSNLPANAKDVKLHLVLAERELRFTGENGIRFHPMAVRAIAGEKGAGLPVTANGAVTYSFNLATIKSEIASTLAAEMVKRHSSEAPGSTPREYVAEGRPYTAIDGSELVVVAFLQDGAYVLPAPTRPIANRDIRPAGAAPTGSQTGADNPASSGSAAADPQSANGAGANQAAVSTGAHGAILQSAKTDVVYAKPASGKGGSR